MSSTAKDTSAPDQGTNGIILFQGFLQYLCQGIVFAQAVKFWKRSASDTVYLRAFVALLLALATLQTAIASYKVWIMTVEQRHWWTSHLYNTDFLVNGLICTVCETYLIRRCWKFSQRNIWVLVALGSLALCAFIANIYLAVRIGCSIGMAPQYSDPLRVSIWAFPFWVYVSLALDLATTSILSIYLWKSRTGYCYLDKTLRNIIGITWESAALPCVFMIISASLFFSGRNSKEVRHLDIFFILSTAKFHTHGLLRTLNSRIKFRESFQHHEDVARQSLGSWLSNAETVVESDETRSIRTLEENEPSRGSRKKSDVAEVSDNSVASAAMRLGTNASEMISSSPEMDTRERGITVRDTDFIIVH
ncbi:unnamed protein product [Somion occarium]|uniref:DUF6534 domain-containing protein n=1 Tax=Somion occarium TaxID=3059160 RepID=A0ABP1CXN4_9APHY